MVSCPLPPPNVDQPEVLKRYLRKLSTCIGGSESSNDLTLEAIKRQLVALTNEVNSIDLSGPITEASTIAYTVVADKEVFATATPPSLSYTAINFLPTTIDGQPVYKMQVNA